MSLVPFSPASSLPAATAAVSARGPAAAPKAAAHAASAHAQRAPSATQGDARPVAARGKGAFATVLAAVQEEDSARGDEPSSVPADTAAPPSAREPRQEAAPPEASAASNEHAAPVAPPPDDCRPAVATSWLWLALEHAAPTRGEDDGAGARAGESPVAAGVVSAGEGAPPAAGTDPAAALALTVPVAPVAAGGAIASAAAGTAGPSAVGVAPAPSAVATPDVVAAATAFTPAARSAPLVAAANETVPAAPEVPPASEEVTSPVEVVEAETPTARPAGIAAEAMARWRAAHRAFEAPAVDDSGGAEPRPPASAPGTAVSRLAHLVGHQPPGELAANLPPLGGDSLAVAPSAATPTARATEVLLRLARAGSELPSRGGDHHAPQAPAFVAAPGSLTSAPPTVPAVAPPQTMPALPAATGEQVTQQLVSSLKMQWKDGVGEAKVHLRPDALGTVSVSLRVEQGAVTAVVRADSPQVQEWVVQHQQTLRQQLEAAGLQLDALTVSPDDEKQQGQPQDAPDERRRQPRRQPGAAGDGPTFEQLL